MRQIVSPDTAIPRLADGFEVSEIEYVGPDIAYKLITYRRISIVVEYLNLSRKRENIAEVGVSKLKVILL